MKKIAWKEVKADQMTPEITRRFISCANATLARFELKRGAIVPEHKHENSQMTWVVEGCLRFTYPGGAPIDVRAGEVLVIPANLPHAAEAIENCVITDVFSPSRADWESGDDAYLRGKK
ncbi:MAG: cupin domain-containing protein [Acidobacteriota bacterium]|nr:cupin domain-containing protein [Acidobacteriota bacterium]